MSKRRILVMGLMCSLGSALEESGEFEVIDLRELHPIYSAIKFDAGVGLEDKVEHEYASLLVKRRLSIRPVEKMPRCYMRV